MKQEKKNKALIVSLISLLLVAVLLFVYTGRSEDINKNVFKISDLSLVDKVVLESQVGEVTISYNGSRWTINSEFDADDQLVTVLFATLQQAEAKRHVSNSIKDSLTQVIRNQGVKVSLHEGERQVKEIFVGGNNSKTEAYFLDEKNGPYIMTIPGYRVYVSGVFEVDKLGWRNKRVFNFNWRNFKKLKTQVHNQQEQSFEIEDMGAGFDLTNTTGTDTTRLNDYLDAVSLLMAKSFIKVGYNSRYDSLLKTQSSLSIEILDLGDNIYSLDLYAPLKGDPNVLGKMSENEIAIFGQDQILPILKTRDYFLRQ